MPDFPVGAHLVSPRRGYMHYGIYAGGGRVIHYAGFDRALRRGPVEEVSLERFTRGRGLAQVPVVAPKYVGAAAVDRARSRIGEDQYRLWSNNCEHFATWSLFGEGRSRQVETWRARLLGPLRVAGAWLSAGSRQALLSRLRPRADRRPSFQMKPAQANA